MIQEELDAGKSPAALRPPGSRSQPPTLTPDMQPAFFLVQARETRVSKPPGMPVKLTLSGFLIVYFQAPAPLLDSIGQEAVVGATALNALLKGIDDAMQPDDPCTGKLTHDQRNRHTARDTRSPRATSPTCPLVDFSEHG